MNKYLVKIAEEVKDKKGISVGRGAAIGFGTAVVADVAGAAAHGRTFDELRKNPTVDMKTMRKILKDNKDLNVTFSKHKAFNPDSQLGKELKHKIPSAGPAYLNKATLEAITPVIKKHMGDTTPHTMKKNFINMEHGLDFQHLYLNLDGRKAHPNRVKNTDVAIHELGHAKDFAGNSKIKRWSQAAGAGLSRTGVGTIAGGAMLGNEKTRDYAWVAPLVTEAPVLRSEAMANIHGHRMIKKHGTPEMVSNFRRLAGKNTVGYWAKPVTASALLYAINKAIPKNKD